MRTAFFPCRIQSKKLTSSICAPQQPDRSGDGIQPRAADRMGAVCANAQDAVLLFDAAYEAFVAGSSLPRSIFEIEGATARLNFCSLSKTAGFTGMRCGYYGHSGSLTRGGASPSRHVAAPPNNEVQRRFLSGAARRGSRYSRPRREGCRRKPCRLPREPCSSRKYAPQAPGSGTSAAITPAYLDAVSNAMSSWDFFDLLLEKAHIVGTPGSGFGRTGELSVSTAASDLLRQHRGYGTPESFWLIAP